MRDTFNDNAEFFDPKARIVNLPAHRASDLDYLSMYDDRYSLKNKTPEQIREEYGIEITVPAQAFAFTTWDKVSRDLPKETRVLLERALAEDDANTPDALKGRVVLSKVLTFKRGR
jgi:hypothetical protein